MNGKKILVHTCCTSCASYVFRELKHNGLTPVAYFSASQLKDKSEYLARLTDLRDYCTKNDIDLVVDNFNSDTFNQLLMPFRDKTSIKHISDRERYIRKRCELCNRLSIENTIIQSKKKHLRYFTTTDLCSPYKDHGLIVELSNQLALEYNVVFYYQDFRKGYWQGRNYARSRGIYTSSFCGCLDSLGEGRLE